LAQENKYKYSKAYYKILSLILDNPNENVFVVRGGQGASKTISILQLIIQSLLSSEKEATILSSELSKMKRTVIRDYKKICKDWGVIQNEDDFNKSESKHEYRNESYLDFLGADVMDVGKGFRRDILYINEADKMNIETAIQFISRARLTIIDYNPDKLFWGDEFINERNFITLTFEDNEFLSESEVKAILEYKQKGFHNPDLPFDELFKESNVKSKYWANKWKVYGLGMVGSLDGVVFDDWKECPEVPLGSELIAIGMDFGFTNDPSTAIKVFRYDGSLYLDEIFYQTGLTNGDIINKLKSSGVTPQMQIVADCAEPKSIEDIRRAGFRIEGARKGEDSIRNSIDTLKQFKIFITSRSVNAKKEFGIYRWSEKNPNEPEDSNNHTVDGVRYVALNKIGKNSGKYSFL
jgi:phage terminase large subunit